MTNIVKKLSEFLPEELKTRIKPIYWSIIRLKTRINSIYWKIISTLIQPHFDSPSKISIEFFNNFEVAYRKGTVDEDVIAHSFNNDIFFSRVPEYQVADGHIILDIGAHIGTFSLLASSKVRRGRVYAIEACEDSFNLLRINVALNNATNISIHHLAITDRKGTCRLYHDRANWGHSIAILPSKHYEIVTSCTLTDFLERNEIDKCHFMKLNCEGAEFPILLSTPRSVLQRFEIILVLYHCDIWKSNTETELLSHFQSSGFRTVVRYQEEKRGWIIAINNA